MIKLRRIRTQEGSEENTRGEALLGVSYHGRARLAELLMAPDLILPHIAAHALTTTCCIGFVDVVNTLMNCGVDINATGRVLLQPSKPSLHTNFNCTAFVAVVVGRQVSIVRLLLQAIARINIKVRLGAWSRDMAFGEEFRVGPWLVEPCTITWYAVEYFEVSGAIMLILIQHLSPYLLTQPNTSSLSLYPITHSPNFQLISTLPISVPTTHHQQSTFSLIILHIHVSAIHAHSPIFIHTNPHLHAPCMHPSNPFHITTFSLSSNSFIPISFSIFNSIHTIMPTFPYPYSLPNFYTSIFNPFTL